MPLLIIVFYTMNRSPVTEHTICLAPLWSCLSWFLLSNSSLSSCFRCSNECAATDVYISKRCFNKNHCVVLLHTYIHTDVYIYICACSIHTSDVFLPTPVYREHSNCVKCWSVSTYKTGIPVEKVKNGNIFSLLHQALITQQAPTPLSLLRFLHRVEKYCTKGPPTLSSWLCDHNATIYVDCQTLWLGSPHRQSV